MGPGGGGGVPKISSTFLGVPHNEDQSILGSRLGFHYFGKPPYNHIMNLIQLLLSAGSTGIMFDSGT